MFSCESSTRKKDENIFPTYQLGIGNPPLSETGLTVLKQYKTNIGTFEGNLISYLNKIIVVARY